MGPDRWGRHSEEWTLMFSRPPGAADLDDDTIVAMVRRTLKLPDDHPMDVESISRWPVEGTVARRFRSGRVFLVGDAAHRHPRREPWGSTPGCRTPTTWPGSWRWSWADRRTTPCWTRTSPSAARWPDGSSNAPCSRSSTRSRSPRAPAWCREPTPTGTAPR
ncbi:hypothetical protein GTW37_20960 [Streptomyces sp. SID4931]|nr:hypothetical protein [Streptomyces sp. SID4931]